MKHIQHVYFHKMLEAMIRDVKSFSGVRVDLADTSPNFEKNGSWWLVHGQPYDGHRSFGYTVAVEQGKRRFYVDVDTFRRTTADIRKEYPTIYMIACAVGGRAFIGKLVQEGNDLADIEAKCAAEHTRRKKTQEEADRKIGTVPF